MNFLPCCSKSIYFRANKKLKKALWTRNNSKIYKNTKSIKYWEKPTGVNCFAFRKE